MNVAIRVDASLKIGVGHMMRCLTLADELVSRDAKVAFVCRQQKGDLVKQTRERGHFVFPLPAAS